MSKLVRKTRKWQRIRHWVKSKGGQKEQYRLVCIYIYECVYTYVKKKEKSQIISTMKILKLKNIYLSILLPSLIFVKL